MFPLLTVSAIPSHSRTFETTQLSCIHNDIESACFKTPVASYSLDPTLEPILPARYLSRSSSNDWHVVLALLFYSDFHRCCIVIVISDGRIMITVVMVTLKSYDIIVVLIVLCVVLYIY